MTLNSKGITSRTAVFLGCGALIASILWLLEKVGNVVIMGEYSSQTLLIPCLCGYLLWNERNLILTTIESSSSKGALVAVAAFASGLSALYFRWVGDHYLFSATAILSAIFLVIGSFVTLYGWNAFRRAGFPFSMLLLAIPFPDSIAERIISILQAQSASLSGILFSMIGIPVYRDGFLLTVPGVTIEVARECSGINSSIALVLTMLLVARQTLNSNSRRAILVLATIPLSILKNAIRIVTLTVLALRVDPSFLTGKLHHRGGFVFYLIAMALMYPIWKSLKSGDAAAQTSNANLVIEKRDPLLGANPESV